MELPTYNKYTYDQLAAMGNVYYKNPNPFQKSKYEQIRSALLAELRTLYPEAKDTGTACYIHAEIMRAMEYKNRHEQELNDRTHANMQTAHNQLKNYWK
jgi:hypothetical protein